MPDKHPAVLRLGFQDDGHFIAGKGVYLTRDGTPIPPDQQTRVFIQDLCGSEVIPNGLVEPGHIRSLFAKLYDNVDETVFNTALMAAGKLHGI